MNINKLYHILQIVAAALLTCAGLASCSQEDFGSGEQFPEGKYPLRFTATVEGMVTRSEGKSAWTGGDVIGVKVGDYEVKGRYRLNEDGTINEAVEAASWLSEAPGPVIGWYPLEPQTDVAISDQTDGFEAIDYLTAIEENQTYKSQVLLKFRHQMAKVSCRLVAGDGVTDAELKTARVSLAGCTSVSFNEGVVTAGPADGWIATTPDHEALLVPQNLTGRPFIKIDITVTANGYEIPKTLTYTPRSDEANLKAGTHHIYTVTVKKDRLEVEAVSGAWTESEDTTPPTSDKYHIYLTGDTGDLGDLEFSSNVTEKSADTRAGSVRCLEVLGNKFTISYKVTADNCYLGPVFVVKNTKNQVSRTYFEKKQNSVNVGYYEFSYKIVSPIGDTVYLKKGEHIEVGDYLFNDGKWGGIPKETYKDRWGKTPVGIVFKGGAGGDSQHNTLDVPGNYGWNDNREIRGYAVALNDASSGRFTWGSTGDKNILDTNVSYVSTNIVNIKYSGIIATNNAKTKGINNYPAFKAVIEYPSAAPEGSSGWYLPSYRQLTDIRNLFAHPQRREWITDAGGNFFTQKTETPYCSATERSSTAIWLQGFVYTENYNANTASRSTQKNYQYYVRGVLTF